MGSDVTVVASSSPPQPGGSASGMETTPNRWGTGGGPSGPDLTPPSTRRHGDASPSIAVNGAPVGVGVPMAEVLADALVDRYRPVAVLDVRCGTGALVAALRRRGVDASGIDRTPEALAGAPDAVRPHLSVADLGGSRPGRYDVAVGVGLVPPAEGDDIGAIVAALAGAADHVVLAPTGDGPLPEDAGRWMTAFAGAGLLRDPDGPLTAAGPGALVLRRQDAGSVAAVVTAYEAHLASQAADAAELRQAVTRLQAELASLQRREARTVAALTETLRLRDLLIVKERRLGEVEGENTRLRCELNGYDDLVKRYESVVRSTVWRTAWKVLGPYRRMRTRLGV
jgi:SAM-dependent methyltransferase